MKKATNVFLATLLISVLLMVGCKKENSAAVNTDTKKASVITINNKEYIFDSLFIEINPIQENYPDYESFYTIHVMATSSGLNLLNGSFPSAQDNGSIVKLELVSPSINISNQTYVDKRSPNAITPQPFHANSILAFFDAGQMVDGYFAVDSSVVRTEILNQSENLLRITISSNNFNGVLEGKFSKRDLSDFHD